MSLLHIDRDEQGREVIIDAAPASIDPFYDVSFNNTTLGFKVDNHPEVLIIATPVSIHLIHHNSSGDKTACVPIVSRITAESNHNSNPNPELHS